MRLVCEVGVTRTRNLVHAFVGAGNAALRATSPALKVYAVLPPLDPLGRKTVMLVTVRVDNSGWPAVAKFTATLHVPVASTVHCPGCGGGTAGGPGGVTTPAPLHSY